MTPAARAAGMWHPWTRSWVGVVWTLTPHPTLPGVLGPGELIDWHCTHDHASEDDAAGCARAWLGGRAEAA